MGEGLIGVALLPTQAEHVAHSKVSGAEQALGGGAGGVGGVEAGGERVGLLGIGEGDGQRAVALGLAALVVEEKRVGTQGGGPGGVEGENLSISSAGGDRLARAPL